jgi:hypothetical protein
MSLWHNRTLIDYCQWIIDYPVTREMGAPFLGEQDKYFSLVDDPEIELLKAIWEGDTYLRIPLSARMKVLEPVPINIAAVYEMASCIVTQAEDWSYKSLVVTEFNRGVWPMAVALTKPLTELVLDQASDKDKPYFDYALQKFLVFCDRQNELQYVRGIIVQ